MLMCRKFASRGILLCAWKSKTNGEIPEYYAVGKWPVYLITVQSVNHIKVTIRHKIYQCFHEQNIKAAT